MIKYRLMTGLLILAVVLTGCDLPAGTPAAAGGEATRAWFDAPLPGSVYVPPNPACQVVAHGASPSGVAMFELSINGQASTIPSPDTASSLATLTRDCGLSEPGEYQLRMRVQDNNGNWSDYADTSLIIAEAGTSTVPAETEAAPPPAAATSTATAQAVGSVSIDSVTPDLIYAGDSSCGPEQVTITAKATAPKGIQVVVLFYRFEPGSPSGFQDVAMTPIGGDLYRYSLNATSELGGPAAATLQYQVVVQQNDGDTSIRTPVMSDVSVEACGQAPQPQVDCSSYHDPRSCQNNGCSWVQVPAVVPVYECKNP